VRLGFLVGRKSHLRHLGPIAEGALDAGHRVTLLCDHRRKPAAGHGLLRRGGRGKVWEFPALAQLQGFAAGRAEAVAFHTDAELVERAAASELDAVFGVNYPWLIGAADRLRARGIVVAQVQAGFDFLYTDDSGTKALFADVTYGYTDLWVDWWAQVLALDGIAGPELEGLRQQLAGRFVAAGLPHADLAGRADPDEVRARLGLPRGRRIVLFLPFPFGKTNAIRTVALGEARGRTQPWVTGIYGAARPRQALTILRHRAWQHWPYVRHGWNDRRVVAEVRKFCDRNDALLVVKTRFQTPPQVYLRRAADRVFSDGPERLDYPPMLIDLLAVSSLCIHFCSGGLMEASASRVPWICVTPSRDEWPHFYDRREELRGWSAVYDWPGVGYGLRVGALIETLATRRLEDFPLVRERSDEYLARFFRRGAGPVARRILADLERRVTARRGEAVTR